MVKLEFFFSQTIIVMTTSRVEEFYKLHSGAAKFSYVMVDSFPQLGMLTALRFLEWAAYHPQGVISLPTGKTPEFFIKWTQHFLRDWNTPSVQELREKLGMTSKPASG